LEKSTDVGPVPYRGLCPGLDPVSRLRYTRAMKRQGTQRGQGGTDDKEARLKAALKANLARRKAQARARKTPADTKSQDKSTPPNED
tara:strand:- start:2157 stop:2417 length:261 start_codon:yes stop_codon:yes gene_type:complete